MLAVLPGLILLAGLGFIAFKVVSALRQSAKLRTASVRLSELLNAHRHAEALQLLESLPSKQQNQGMLRLVRGSVLLALWRPRDARELLQAVVRRPKFTERPISALAKPELAMACALLGERPEAQAMIDAQPHDPKAVLAAAVLAAREGRFDNVRALMLGDEAYQLSGVYRAFCEVLLAWSELRLEGAAAQPINPVMLWAESGPEQLKACWPELLAAIEALEIAERQAQPALGA